MAKHVKRSVVPIYLVGAVWLAYALLFPLYQPVHYLLCGALSAAAFIVGKGLFPNKVYEVPGEPEENKQEEPEKKEPPKSTGDPEIEDEGISAQIDHLEEVTRKIIDLVVKQPKKLPQIRRFLDYYLPTTLKILNAYDRMDAAGISGENIDATKKKVEQMMATISQAFDRQLDALFGDEALDISTDITVMEQMLQREGLGGQKKDGDGGVTLEL